MLTGILAKYESTEQGYTVTLKCQLDQGQVILSLHKKEVTIQELQTTIEPDRTQLLSEILTSLDVIKKKLEGAS